MEPYRGATLDAAAALRERAREKELAKAKYKEARERDQGGKEAKEAIREAKAGCLSIDPLPSRSILPPSHYSASVAFVLSCPLCLLDDDLSGEDDYTSPP